MRKKILLVLALFIGLFLFNQSAPAQGGEYLFTVSGRVATDYNDSQNGIANALITLQPHGNGNNAPYPSYVAVSDSDGYFSVQVTSIGEPGFHYHVFCQRSPYAFADFIAYEEDSFFYFVPIN